MNTNGWKRPNCRFVMTAYRRILGNYLEQQGFTEIEADGFDGVLYTRFDLFFAIDWEEPTPDLPPSVVLEFSERHCDEEGRLATVPAWHEIPDEQRMRGYWAFQNDEELEMLLPEIRSKLMEAAEKHLWLSQDALEKVISSATIPGQRQ